MKHLLLFDGACGLCTKAAAIARRVDRRGKFAIEPYQTYSEPALAGWGLSYRECDRKVQVVTHTGKVHSGAFAVNYFFSRQFPWSILVVLLYAVPVLLLIEIAAYALVARNRHRISAWLGMKACVPKPGADGE